MADWYYGSKNHHWRAACGFSSSWDGYGQTFRLEAGAQAEDGYSYDIYGGAHWEIWFNGALIGSGSTRYNVGANGYKRLGYAEVHYNRQQWDQTFSWSVKVSWGSGFGAGSSTCSGSCFEAALEHHIVSYDGNGGSTPGSQTKWYGTILTLQGTPSRAGYGFDGWKASDGRIYAAGGQYEADADCTMTAQWHTLYKPPTCTLKAVRTESMTTATETVSGSYVYVTAAWKVDTSATSGNAAKSVKLEYRVKGASSWSTATTSGTQTGRSGTARAWFAASTGSSYEVRCTVTDSVQGTSFMATVGTAVVPIDFGCKGRSVGLLSVASDTPDTIAMRGTMIADGAKYPIGDSGWKTLYDGGSANGYVKYRRMNGIAIIEFSVLKEVNGFWLAGTLPAGYRPDRTMHIAALTVGNDGTPLDHVTGAIVDTAGQVTIMAAAHVAGQWAEGLAAWIVTS